MAEHSPGVHITVVTISSTTKGKRTESTQQFPSTVGPLSTPLSNGGALFHSHPGLLSSWRYLMFWWVLQWSIIWALWLVDNEVFSYFWVWRIFLYSEYSSFIRCITWQYFSRCATLFFLLLGWETELGALWCWARAGPPSCTSSPFHSSHTIIWKYFFCFNEALLFIYLFI